VQIVGDIPIFLAHDSADVWAHQELFQLDADGMPTVVAGVPPDYFSPTGQLWGNPHYRWDVMADTGYAWWIERFRTLRELVDTVRLDHFRGFAASWEVPCDEDTAINGTWAPGPGSKPFEAVRDALGSVSIIAEDLGVITPDVVELRKALGYPGMKVLQFAFSSDPTNESLPHNLDRDTVVYTATHDNDTTVGWFSQASLDEKRFALDYLGSQGIDIAWDLIRVAFASTAVYAIVPLQDVLRLGSQTRMNIPGRSEGNWTWRFRWEDVTELHLRGLRFLADTYGRTAHSPAPSVRS
jgi:4-alpha-glucanotransferase